MAVLPYVVKARARRDIERLAQWWATHRTAAPGAVRLDLEQALFIICRHPGLGQRVDIGRPVELRRYLMTLTSHWLYFRVKDGAVEVVAVWSSQRGSGPHV